MWAQDAIYSWNGNGKGSAQTANETGGTATAKGGNSNVVVGAKEKGNWCLKLGKGFSSGVNYIEITLDNALTGGEIVIIGSFTTNSSATATATLGIDFGTTDTQTLYSDHTVLTSNGTPDDWTITVPTAANNSKTIRLYRNAGSTTVFVSKLIVLSSTYTVTYDANGATSGTAPVDETEYDADNNTVTVLGNTGNLAKTDYIFSGWNTKADGSGTTYTAGETFTISASTTLYAKWTPVSSGVDYATLPFSWAGGSSADLQNVTGVTVNCNASDYASGNSPYLVKFSSDGHFIMVKTDSQPGKVTVGVKMLGGSVATSITVQGSADGVTFTDVETLTISGDKNSILNLETSNAFAATDRYVRLYFNKGSGSNVGVGPITIAKPSTDPQIVADATVELAYDAIEGAISYTINNPVDGGVLTAAVTEGNWVTIGTVGTTVPFTCSANEATTARTATVTLTYTYNSNETITKTVTVTQAAAPVVYSTIPALFAAATSTATDVNVTFNNWVVSGVSTNGKNVFVTDNSGNGFVIFDNNGGLSDSYVVGDILSGTAVSCKLVLYNGFAEITNLNAGDLTITTGGTVSAAEIAMANLAGVNTGALVSYENLTCSVSNNKYYLSDGTTTLQVYNALFAFDALEDGNTYNITGIYQQYNNTKEILPRSADDIEEVVSTEPQIVVEATTINLAYNATSGEIPFTIVNPVENASFGAGTIDTPWITNVNAVKIDATHYKVTFNTEANSGEERSATITINYNGVTKDVSVTQAAYVAPFEITDGFFDFTQDEDYGSGLEKSGVKDQTSTWTAVNVVMYMAGRNCWFDGTPDQIRLYKASGNSAAGSITLSVPTGNVITKVAFTGASLNKMNAEDGTYTVANDNKSATWTGASNSIKFIASDRTDIETISVTYSTTVTIAPAHEYITFSAACNLDFSQVDGLDTYIVTKVNETSVSIQKIEAAVPAGTGLILKKTGTVSSFEVPVVAEATAPEGNLLTGVTKPTLIGNTTATDYILYDGTFYPASQGTLPAGKAYLRVANTSAPELGLDFSGETTGIVNVNRETITNNQYYTLDGRRVENPTNGIYIINGRKVVIK